jgi:hypothetical protein
MVNIATRLPHLSVDKVHADGVVLGAQQVALVQAADALVLGNHVAIVPRVVLDFERGLCSRGRQRLLRDGDENILSQLASLARQHMHGETGLGWPPATLHTALPTAVSLAGGGSWGGTLMSPTEAVTSLTTAMVPGWTHSRNVIGSLPSTAW